MTNTTKQPVPHTDHEPVPHTDLKRLVRLATTAVFTELPDRTTEQVNADAALVMRYRELTGIDEH